MLFFKTIDVGQLYHWSWMYSCFCTLYQEWKSEKQDLLTGKRTWFMGVNLHRSANRTCSDKADLSDRTAYCICLQITLENCIQTQFASNLHQIIDITWWFLATLEFQIRFWGIISIRINRNSIYKLDCVVKLVSIVRRPVQPRQVTLLTPSPGATLQSGSGQGVTSKL